MQYKQINITKIYIYIWTIIDTILTFTAIVDYLWLLCTHDCLCKSYVFRYWILYLNCFMFLQNRHLKAESISNLTLFVDTICQIIRSILVTILCFFVFVFFINCIFRTVATSHCLCHNPFQLIMILYCFVCCTLHRLTFFLA